MTAEAEPVKIEVIDAWLMIRRNTLASHKVVEVESTLQKQDVKYYIPRVEVKTYTFAQGLQNLYVRNSITERDIPNRVVVAVVSNTAYNGSKTLNPFNFKHYNMISADITIDSRSVFGKPLTMNMATSQYMQPYWRTMGALGYHFRDDGC